MSRATRNLINASIHISNLQENYLRDILQNLLASNPSIVLKAIETKGFHFEKTEKKTITELLVKKDEKKVETYKVVLTDYDKTHRINLIKFVRQYFGYSLVESKRWTDGQSVNGKQAGVFYTGLTASEATIRVEEIRAALRNIYYAIHVHAIPDSTKYEIPPYVRF